MDPSGNHGKVLGGLLVVCILGIQVAVLQTDRLGLQKAVARAEAENRKIRAAVDTIQDATLPSQVESPAEEKRVSETSESGYFDVKPSKPAVLEKTVPCQVTDATNLKLLRDKVLSAAAEVEYLERALKAAKKEVPTYAPTRMKTSYKDPSPRSPKLYQRLYELPHIAVPPGLREDPFPRIERGCTANQAILLSENPGVVGNDTAACAVVDVIYQRYGEGRCTVIMDQPCTWHNYVYKQTTEYYGSSSTWSVKMNTTSGRPMQEQISRNVMYGGNLMRDLNNRDNLIVPFLENKGRITKEILEIIGKPPASKKGMSIDEAKKRTMLVMATNEGHATMVINFFCDLHSRGQKTPQHIIFATTKRLRDQLQQLGLTAYWDDHLGTYGDKAEPVYGTIGFGRLTYMKQFSTYLILNTGWDVLFQDADVTWPKDPFPALLKQRDRYHAQFMDDGARTFRFAPFFANSGFYYISAHTGQAIEFWDQVTMSMGESQTGNQETLNAILEFQYRKRGFKLRILPPEEFASGKLIGEPKNGQKGDPSKFTVAHFCWTHNMEVKRERMMQWQSRHLIDDCFNDIWKCKFDELSKSNMKPAQFAIDSQQICPKL